MFLHGKLTQFVNVLCGAYKGAKAETSIQSIVWSGNKLTEENTGRSIATVKEKGSFKKKGISNKHCKMQRTKSIWSVRV